MLRVIARVATALLLLGAVIGAARFVIHGPVKPSSLAHSVAFETDSAGIQLGYDECERGPRKWICDVLDSSGSGSARYAVVVDEGSCWRARRMDRGGYEGVMPRTAEGCVHLIEWSLLELL